MVSYPDDDGSARSSRPSLHHTQQHSSAASHSGERYRSSSRAPSVASSTRSSTTLRPSRRERHHAQGYSKSHAGVTLSSGSSSGHSVKNEFPRYERTGDVEIVLKSGRTEVKYVLHKLYLAQNSGWFEDILGLGDGPDLTTMSQGRKLRFELDWGVGDNPMPMLISKPWTTSYQEEHTPKPPPLRSKPPPPSSGFFRSMANFSALHVSQPAPTPGDEVLTTYDNLLRVFYNHEPIFDKTNIAVAYSDCKALLQLASSYEALPVIGPRIDHHLLRFGSRLWKQIAKYPPSYLKLGYLARSRAIFSEALIHVVGMWPAGEHALRGQVPQDVLDLVEDKVDEIDELRAKVEQRLWRLTLTTGRGDRVGPHTAWLDWLVLSLFRQWFAENTTPAPASILKEPGGIASRSSSHNRGTSRSGPAGHNSTNTASASIASASAPAPVGLARAFRLLATGGQSYLPHDEVKRFLKQSPELYSRDNVRRAERRLDELKNLARDAVQPLARNFLELDAAANGGGGGGGGGSAAGGERGRQAEGVVSSVPYWTCVRVAENEWPWD